MQNSHDDQSLSRDLIQDLIKERRSERRWKNIRFFVVLLIGLFIAFGLIKQMHKMSSDESDQGYAALIHLDGIIAPGQDFSAENTLPILQNAFRDKEAKGVILNINSGGGTPVQAAIIHDAILELKKKYNKKVIVVGEDVMASGAYYVAVAADKIYVNPNTITGSIGVIMKGFGFPELIKKLGIERRVITAGENKDRLDPFLPETPEDIAKIRQVIDEVHKNFEQAVLTGRQGKLHAEGSVLFSGDFWSGQTALKLGLVDGLGNLSNVMQTEFHVSTYKDYSQSGSLLKSIASQLGASFNMALDNKKTLMAIF